MGINKVILVGNVGRDPESRALPSGTTLTKFSMATSEPRFKNDAGEAHTEWHNIVVWGRLGEIAAQYIRRGRQIYLEGRIRVRKYEKDGQTRYFQEIHADNFELLGRREDGEGGGGGGGSDSYGGGGGGSSYGSGGSSSSYGGGGGGSSYGGGQGGGGAPSPPDLPDDDDVPF